ncbi:hypothetical protein CTI14_00885 [Methylobacterium radiotolerans]|nr:hypothetical protein CTI14_00885 [Methylobacterium radiotolerans]
MKFSPPPALVTVSVARSERLDGTFIVVADCGPGIPKEEIDRVTEPYYRARNSGGIPGAGLGLHLVRRYVTAHGGELEIVSGAGRGTAVRLHLPGAAA